MSAMALDALRYPNTCDGIDVSAVQTIGNASMVAYAGFQFAFVKASEGTGYMDPRRLDHLKKLRDAGLLCSVYGFCRPSQGNPREQAKRLYEAMGDTFECRTVIDLESAPDVWTAAQLVAFGEEFADEIASWGIAQPILYTYPSFAQKMQPALGASTRLAMCPLWIAQYRSVTEAWVPPIGAKPIVPKPWANWSIWQYSGNGGFRVPGIIGDCDRNLFQGDFAALRRFFGRVDPDAETAPQLVHPRLFTVDENPRPIAIDEDDEAD